MEDHPQPAFVIARWNSWVRVLLPETGEKRWVDLTALETWAPLEEEEERALQARF